MTIKYQKDYELVDRYIRGDRDAGEELYRNIFPMVTASLEGMATKKGLSESEIPSVINETWMTSIRKLNCYNGSSKFSTYVIGIGKNLILERKRKLIGPEGNSLFLDDNMIMFPQSEQADYYSKEPLEIVMENEKMQALKEAYGQLKLEYRKVIELRYAGMTCKQAGELLGKSEDAVESLFRRAIVKWKKLFEEIYN